MGAGSARRLPGGNLGRAVPLRVAERMVGGDPHATRLTRVVMRCPGVRRRRRCFWTVFAGSVLAGPRPAGGVSGPVG